MHTIKQIPYVLVQFEQEANVWIFTFDVKVLHIIQFSSV